ncbi:hypothetical protein SEA_ATUIN_274 [Arthrobacter phage Atuin]|nr:hypothetical protein SEA_ATUIN_73 [Arthrobacter phage Atuin]
MTQKQQVGKKLYDARGDDFFIVNKTLDGDVIEIEQYDSIALVFTSINFFSKTAPKLIELIRQAAGIKPEEVEYEYNIEETSRLSGEVRVGSYWGELDYMRGVLYRRRKYEQSLADYTPDKIPNHTYRLLRRPVEVYEVMEGE